MKITWRPGPWAVLVIAATWQLRNQAIDFMRAVGAGVSAAAVQAAFPALARREAENLRNRFRHIWKLDHPRAIHVLHWHDPRVVWAMDHSQPPQAIDDRWPYLLAVRDLASGCQLAWLPVLDETAETTIECLAMACSWNMGRRWC